MSEGVHPPRNFSISGTAIIRVPFISLLIPELSLINFIPGNLFESIKSFIVYPIRVVPPCVSKIIWLFYIYFHILINDYLEEMEKTIYDYWFVQFDFPDENGKPYKSSGGALLYNEVLKKEIPFGWTIDTLGNLLSKVPNSTKIPVTNFCDNGSIPVIDQSSNFIAGYTDDETSLLFNKTGYIVFGDHTRVVKYIRFPFARGADGTQVINSNNRCMPNELFYQVIKSIDLSNHGYARHFIWWQKYFYFFNCLLGGKQFKKWH